MKRITYWILLAIMLIMTGLQAEAKKKGPAGITFAETTYNFGTIAETKGVVSHQFEFTNTGDKPLVIVDATAECGCTTPEFPVTPIQPGKKGVIKVTYNPLGRPGGFTKAVTVKTNGKPKKARIYIKGVVNPNKR